MDISKKKLVLDFGGWLIFIYLILFPFGQLIRLTSSIFGLDIPIHPTDIIVLVTIPLFIFYQLKLPSFFPAILNFLAIATFSLIFSLTYFPVKNIFIGSLYLIRFLAYTTFFLLVWNIIIRTKNLRVVLFDSLILVCFFISIFGWIQYFWIPDLTSLKYIGWDDHLYRLVGTFLDPGFTSIIIVFGFLASFNQYLQRGHLKIVPLIIFFVITLAFTYARAAYLAIFIGTFTLVILNKKFKSLLWPLLTLLLIVIFLPRPAGEGVKLERTHSLLAKVENYSQTLEIINKQPLFGVGFNNLCSTRMRLFADSFESHACTGADSSLLMVIATTGIIGFIVFLYMVFGILTSVSQNFYGITFMAASAALFTHSLFVNSLFYPWIMGWIGVLLALSIKEKR